MVSAGAGSLAIVFALIGLSACEETGQPGPVERAGVGIDHAIAGAERGVGEFSLRAGRGLDDAGRSVGTAAQQAGTQLHDRLVPADTNSAQNRPAPPDGAPRGSPPGSE